MDDYIKSNGLESDIKYSSKDQLLKIDEKRIEQVIKNLVSNAVEHAYSFIQISVNMHGDKLTFQIFNDGDSISDEDLPYIFDSFYKSSKKKTGTGLGLAIVKEIINLHNGSYRVENTKNGVKFTVTF
jgi:signal transduction histidine kinase